MAKMTAAEKEKRTPKFLKKIFSSPRKEKAKAAKASVEQGKRNKAATSKMYAAESMFKSAKNRDVAKTTPGKARSFKDAFDAANKANKDKFLHKGKSYFTTKGAADNRDKMKTRTGKAGSMSSAAPKKVEAKKGDRFSRAKTKFGQSRTLKEFFSKLKKKK